MPLVSFLAFNGIDSNRKISNIARRLIAPRYIVAKARNPSGIVHRVSRVFALSVMEMPTRE